ncbi:hypothetical protein DY000_02023013 [Brassica cretica]|uniref:Uncharacterized protein n=1 Tax=Brassica cretica TaxID=69181 RepID=A0ABQ7E5E4_BRACR|nr:hypothetical protein DY000_02023013 [Brassica cretica]
MRVCSGMGYFLSTFGWLLAPVGSPLLRCSTGFWLRRRSLVLRRCCWLIYRFLPDLVRALLP